MPIPLLSRALLAFASLVAVPALAQTFSCPEIKAVLTEADREFSALKGSQLKKETAEDFARAKGLPAGKQDFKYQRLVHAANKPLTGPVTGCQVVEAYLEDDESTIRQSSYVGAAAVLLALPVSFFAAAAADFAPIRGPLRSSIMPGANPLRRAPAQGSPDSLRLAIARWIRRTETVGGFLPGERRDP